MTTAAAFESLGGLVKRKEAGTTPLNKQVICVYGEQGRGKTSLVAGFENALYLDLESSLGDAHAANSMHIPSWDVFVQLVNAIASGADLKKVLGIDFDPEVIIIDTVAELWSLKVKHAWAERGLRAWPDDFQRTLDAVRTEFKQVLDLLRAQAKLGRLGVVFVAHEKVNVRKDPVRGEVSTILADAGDHSRNNNGIDHYISAKPHIVLRCLIAHQHPLDPTVQWPEGRFLVQANPQNDGTVVKDRSMRLPAYFGNSFEVLEREYKLGPEGRAKAKAKNKDN